MMKLRGCKKCQGALILDKDEFGWFEECIQCGYTRDIPLDVLSNAPEAGDTIPVAVISGKRNPIEAWKHNKIPFYTPFKDIDGLQEDAY